MGRGVRRLAAVLQLCLLVGSCTGRALSTGTDTSEPAAESPVASPAEAVAPSPTDEGATAPSAERTAKPKRPVVGPSPAELPWEPDATIDASLFPTCVSPNGAITITVNVPPKSSIAYVAVYADNESGAEPPWGKGYGGSDGAVVEQPPWRSTWTLASNTPIGPARVDVVGYVPEGRGYAAVPFEVREAGAC